MKLALSYNYTFTDHIDNVDQNSVSHPIYGDRQGKKGGDKFLHSFVTLQYDFSAPKEERIKENEDPYLAILDERDRDKDGVPDILDNCPGTPKGIAVDKNGCPLDSDKDGIPDYLDKESKTNKKALVDLEGKEITEGSGLMKPILRYELSISEGDTSIVQDESYAGYGQIGAEQDSIDLDEYSYKDTTEYEEDTTILTLADIVPELDEQDSISTDSISLEEPIVTIQDTIEIPDNDAVTEESIDDKITSKESIVEQPLPEIDDNIVNEPILTEKEEVEPVVSPIKLNEMPAGLIYTVQVGAYKNEVPLEKVTVLLNMEGIKKTMSTEGLIVFNVGEFKNLRDAIKLQDIIIDKGIEDAFVTAYQDGNRIPIQTVRPSTSEPTIQEGDQLVVQRVEEQNIEVRKIPENEIVTIQTDNAPQKPALSVGKGTKMIVTAPPQNDSIPVTIMDDNLGSVVNISIPANIDASTPIQTGNVLEIVSIDEDYNATIAVISDSGQITISKIPIKSISSIASDKIQQPVLSEGTKLVITEIPQNDNIPVTIIDDGTDGPTNLNIPLSEIDPSLELNIGDTLKITDIDINQMVTISTESDLEPTKVSKVPVQDIKFIEGEVVSFQPTVSIGDTLKIKGQIEETLTIQNESQESEPFTATTLDQEIPDKPSQELIEKYEEMPPIEEIINIIEEGIVVKVQVGAFRYAVPLQLLDLFMKLGIKDVVYYLNPSDSLTRFNTGSFKNYNDANSYRNDIISKGIEDAFLVAFKDGERIQLFEALSLLKQPIEILDIVQETTPKPVQESTPSTVQESDKIASLSSGLIFKVQIGAYQSDTPIDLFQKIEAITSEPGPNGYTRYTAGVFRSYDASELFKNDVINKGIKDAFIVSYNNGKRMSMNAAVNILNNMNTEEQSVYQNVTKLELDELSYLGITNTQNASLEPENIDTGQESTGKITFKIQIGVFRSGVPPEIWELFQQIEDLKSHTTTDDLTVYTTGSFSKYEEATFHKQKIKEIGVEDAFITAYFDNRIISVQDAIVLSNNKSN
ncbi:MAG: thrombospondin type 3 repeat-containing protein [Bacteroidia bacterium]|nr:thrombospondin type 3 repeat-containing protein [Bacteroidia bacterium]